jgi:phosphatidylinositol alpha-1,6-mannosyltransferase
MMRHLFVTNDFPPKLGGTESYLVNLCAGFAPNDVAVVAPAREGHESVDASIAYKVFRIEGNYLRASDAVRDRVIRSVHEHSADVTHFLQTVPLGRLAAPVREATRTPVTIVTHGTGDLLVPARTPVVRRVARQALCSADLVLANSNFTREAVVRFTKGRARRIAVLRPSVDTTRFSLEISGARVRAKHSLGARFVVLFVSRLVKRKGAEALLRAMPGVPRATALIVGAGPEEKSLRRLARELDLGERAIFAGSIPDDELPAYYAAADVFCMPGAERLRGLDVEGFGVVYLEAAATGLPAVAGDSGGTAEAVLDGETGVVLDESTPPAIAEALRLLQQDGAMRARLGAAARARAEAELDSRVIAGLLEQELAEAGIAPAHLRTRR